MTRHSHSSAHANLYTGLPRTAPLRHILRTQRLNRRQRRRLIYGGITASYFTATQFGNIIIVFDRSKLRRLNRTLQPVRASHALFAKYPALYMHIFENLSTEREIRKHFGANWRETAIELSNSLNLDHYRQRFTEREWIALNPIKIRNCITRIDSWDGDFSTAKEVKRAVKSKYRVEIINRPKYAMF